MNAGEQGKVQLLRSGAQMRLEASTWIARLNADRISDDDLSRFEAWRNANPGHARAYEQVMATWRQLNQTGRLVSSVALGQALGASTQNAIRRSLRSSRRRFVFAMAASFAAAAMVGAWWMHTLTPGTVFQTAIGEHATIELPDGSSLDLNSNSRAHVDYTAQRRLIRLERGEAFFDVEHDPQRPFWVVGGGSWVRAIGTAFNVDVRSAGVRVTVSEGAVKVAGSMPNVGAAPSDIELERASVSILRAGQQVSVQGAASEVRSLAPQELTRSVSWRSGTIYYQDERLGSVVDELSRYTTLNIVIEDAALRDLGIAGTFETTPQGAEALLTTLQDGFKLKVRRDGRSAYISAVGPGQ